MLNRLWPFCSMYLKNDPTLWVCTFDREPSLIEILKDDGERDSIGKLMFFCSVFAQELQHENIVALYDVQVSHYWWFSSLVENEGVNNVSPTFTTLGAEGGRSQCIYKKKKAFVEDFRGAEYLILCLWKMTVSSLYQWSDAWDVICCWLTRSALTARSVRDSWGNLWTGNDWILGALGFFMRVLFLCLLCHCVCLFILR